MQEIDWKKVFIIGISAAAVIAIMYVLLPVFRAILYFLLLVCLLMSPIIILAGLVAGIIYLARR